MSRKYKLFAVSTNRESFKKDVEELRPLFEALPARDVAGLDDQQQFLEDAALLEKHGY